MRRAWACEAQRPFRLSGGLRVEVLATSIENSIRLMLVGVAVFAVLGTVAFQAAILWAYRKFFRSRKCLGIVVTIILSTGPWILISWFDAQVMKMMNPKVWLVVAAANALMTFVGIAILSRNSTTDLGNKTIETRP